MHLPTFENLATAYLATLNDLVEDGDLVSSVLDPTSVGSMFGQSERPTLELQSYGFRVEDPSACLLHSRTRQPDLTFAMGQWLWAMRGSDDLEEIAFYNGRGRAFSDDGQRLNAACGARMRSEGDQLEGALSLLRNDPTSRRALIVLARGGDLLNRTRDHSCAVSLHFLLRGGRLEAITTMRSQSALMVLPYDAALFMAVHAWAAASLGVPCGPHTWHASSMHLYEDEVSLAQRLLDDPPDAVRLPTISRPRPSLERLQALERELRCAVIADEGVRLHQLSDREVELDDMHTAVWQLLISAAAERMNDGDLARQAVAKLPPDWIDSLAARAPEGRLAR